jgi:hypothetical protein
LRDGSLWFQPTLAGATRGATNLEVAVSYLWSLEVQESRTQTRVLGLMLKERIAISFHVELTASQDSDRVGLGTTSPSLDN